jgi:ubiquinone/menaquinone biosynthesis C-methylase UbiE
MKIRGLAVLVILAVFTHLECFAQNYEAQTKRVAEWEKRINDERQPPEKVMDAIGVKPGMIIGEVGAGRGRYTVHLAKRVGKNGKIYANDISEKALDYLRERCLHHKIKNIEIILGKEEDPLFSKKSLDMAIMVWVYHMLEKPVPLLKNLKPSLKPGATLVLLEPPDYEINEEMKQMGRKLDPPTLKERIEKGAKESGFELIRVESFLPKDKIYILEVK